jgi:hypothetical protein
MTVKSQLNACRDSLMAGMRAASRGASPDEGAGAVLRACLDLVEHSLAREPSTVTSADIGTTLGVLERASAELEDAAATPHAVSTALINACKRLRLLIAELDAA